MPPKQKITKEDIISAALAIVRRDGMDAMNARALAKELDCSTQPVFSQYATMEELKSDVLRAAKEYYDSYIAKAMTEGKYPPYKASGMAYIRFAGEEKELFRLLFMRRRDRAEAGDDEETRKYAAVGAKTTGLDPEESFRFHIEMWVFVHGIASMIVTDYLDWDEDVVSGVLTDAFEGMKHVFSERRKEKGKR